LSEAEQNSGSGDGAPLRSFHAFFPPFTFFNHSYGTFSLCHLPCQVSLSLTPSPLYFGNTSKKSDRARFAGRVVEAQSPNKFSNSFGTIAFPLL